MIKILPSFFALVLLVSTGFISAVSAGPLEEALVIAIAQSEALHNKQRMTNIANQGSNLSTKFKVASGFADKSNDEFAGGFQNRAMLTFEYPLTGGISQTDKEKVQALGAYYEAKDNFIRTFILEMQKLAALKSTYDIKNRVYSFSVDMLTRLKKANEAAKANGRKQDIVELSDKLNQTLTAENDARQAWSSYNTMHQSICRIYGKDDWRKLAIHTTAYIEELAPTPKSIYKEEEDD